MEKEPSPLSQKEKEFESCCRREEDNPAPASSGRGDGGEGNVPLKRRLTAMFYDSLLVFALLMAAGALSLPVTSDYLANYEYPLGYRLYLLTVMYVYFAISWHKQGQTLGMRTWKIRLERTDGRLPTWWDTFLRFIASIISLLPLGLGFWWSIWDKDKRCWHDILSGTRLVRVDKTL
jgi:uncharacterized RDD family membrane protein YckC